LNTGWINIIGTVAAVCSMASFVPQIVKIVREHHAQSVSFRMYAITVTGFFLWTAYGLLIGSAPVIGSNLICLMLSLTILILKLRFGRPSEAGDQPTNRTA